MGKPKACTCEHYKAKEPHEYTCNMNINQHTKKRDSMEKATARPWKVERINNNTDLLITTKGKGRHIGSIQRYGNPQLPVDETEEANAALIVRAVNAHDKLVEAVSQILNRLDHHGNIDAVREEGPIDDLRNALKLAKGE